MKRESEQRKLKISLKVLQLLKDILRKSQLKTLGFSAGLGNVFLPVANCKHKSSKLQTRQF
jgi:hypothetical protein